MLIAHFSLQIIYTFCIIGLALYGLQAFWLSLQSYKHHTPPQIPLKDPFPRVTVQLPIYNERHVVERLLSACARLKYPADRLQIQVLDDSNDNTTALLQLLAQNLCSQGLDVVIFRRNDRSGFKAGALAEALPRATGDYIAIFDADFVPPSDFLLRTLPYFLESGNEQIGFVQARWGHLNPTTSWLTRCQALALDGHFGVEQPGRAAAGYSFGFNGSAGIWRRACIEDTAVGGWHADTLCEDLDLSYRAQFAGWRGCFISDLTAPGEIPVQMLAFKRQQFRWAKGSVQTLTKLSRRVLEQPWSKIQRIAALCHLGGYLIHPLLLSILIITLPMLLLGVDPVKFLAPLSIFSLGPPLLYAISQYRLTRRRWLRRWAHLPLLMLLGTGLCVNNTVAVFQALRKLDSPFLRTPKFHADRWQESVYRLRLSNTLLGEMFVASYALVTVMVAMLLDQWTTVPFMLIYAGGLLLMIGSELSQAWDAMRSRSRPTSVQTRLETYVDRLRT